MRNHSNLPWEIENFLSEKNNQLQMNGVSMPEIAEKFGTPVFVFSELRIAHNIKRLQKAEKFISVPLKICYAAKANSNMAILRTVKKYGSDLEVNSGGELFKALKIGFKPEQIIFNGTSKTIEELEAAISAGIYAIQADSIYEISLIEKVARKLSKQANVSLRIVPAIETDTRAGLKTAMDDSKFGMTFDDAISAFQTYAPKNEFVNLCGIHLHIGSQTPNPSHYTDALKFLWEKLVIISEKTNHKLTHLNLGGGFPVNYLRDESESAAFQAEERNMFAADFEPFEAIGAAWKTIEVLAEESNSKHLLENIELLIEPGRSLIADAGICLTKVRNRKERILKNDNKVSEASKQNSSDFPLSTPDSRLKDDWLLTDAGFNILLSMETYKWYYRIISAERAAESHESPYKMAGPLCDGGDVYFDIEGAGRLPDYRLLPENVQPDEVLALLNCGAYSIAQMFQYNGRFLPAVVIIKENGEPELIRRRDNFEDLITNDIW